MTSFLCCKMAVFFGLRYTCIAGRRSLLCCLLRLPYPLFGSQQQGNNRSIVSTFVVPAPSPVLAVLPLRFCSFWLVFCEPEAGGPSFIRSPGSMTKGKPHFSLKTSSGFLISRPFSRPGNVKLPPLPHMQCSVPVAFVPLFVLPIWRVVGWVGFGSAQQLQREKSGTGIPQYHPKTSNTTYYWYNRRLAVPSFGLLVPFLERPAISRGAHAQIQSKLTTRIQCSCGEADGQCVPLFWVGGSRCFSYPFRSEDWHLFLLYMHKSTACDNAKSTVSWPCWAATRTATSF